MLRFVLVSVWFCAAACKSGQTKADNTQTLVAHTQPTATKEAVPVKKTTGGKTSKKAAIVDEDENTAPEVNPPIVVKKPITNPYEYTAFLVHTDEEHKRFGTAERAKKYKKKKYGNSVVEQRSGRMRLYDHNIFLRALFDGRISSETYGNLKDQFEDGIFLDIGSAILFGEGANTVRDLFEDKRVSSKLVIIASDINDRSSKKTMYVDIYREAGEKLPFPVVEVAMLMDKPEHFTEPLKLFLKSGTDGVILRSANAGPDLYYDKKQVHRHLRAAILAFYDKNLIYLFNKYILYKPKKRNNFLIIGEIDDQVGTNHRKATWEEIDWDTRTFEEAVRLNQQHVQYK